MSQQYNNKVMTELAMSTTFPADRSRNFLYFCDRSQHWIGAKYPFDCDSRAARRASNAARKLCIKLLTPHTCATACCIPRIYSKRSNFRPTQLKTILRCEFEHNNPQVPGFQARLRFRGVDP